MLAPVVRFTAICEPGLVVTLTTLPDGTGVFIAQLRPVVKFWIVGVPGPTIVHSGQASALPPLIIVALPITALDASWTGSMGRIPAEALIVNIKFWDAKSDQYGSGV